MKAIFLSDAHLRSCHDKSYQALMRFLKSIRCPDSENASKKTEGRDETTRPCASNLFLVGDIFDFWFCKNHRIYPDFLPVIDALVALKERGVQIIIYEGNHDFFLEDYFSKTLGMDVVREWADFYVDDLRFLVSHGDTVDETNTGHLLLRNFLRSRFAFTLQQFVPSLLLWKMAKMSSTISRNMSPGQEEAIKDKMLLFSMKKFQEGYDAVILGHSHKPFLKNDIVIAGKRKTFAALGDWITYYSYLCYEDGRFDLKYYHPDV
jgi:UDP-2,3-diacylglucosamine hydrolase